MICCSEASSGRTFELDRTTFVVATAELGREMLHLPVHAELLVLLVLSLSILGNYLWEGEHGRPGELKFVLLAVETSINPDPPHDVVISCKTRIEVSHITASPCEVINTYHQCLCQYATKRDPPGQLPMVTACFYAIL